MIAAMAACRGRGAWHYTSRSSRGQLAGHLDQPGEHGPRRARVDRLPGPLHPASEIVRAATDQDRAGSVQKNDVPLRTVLAVEHAHHCGRVLLGLAAGDLADLGALDPEILR